MVKLSNEVLGALATLKRVGLVKEANLILKIASGKIHGRFHLVVQNGALIRIEKEIVYDDLSSGLDGETGI